VQGFTNLQQLKPPGSIYDVMLKRRSFRIAPHHQIQ